ncbi:MAG: transcription elongation factor GreA [Gammaproteobacteria bacterium]|nr:transcription elongation factor GreA [Gammaproteobacteria bacterium]
MNKVPLTKIGADKMREELKKLKNEDRPRIIADIAEARAHGDLKENAEYHAAREEQGFTEARIKDFEGKLSNAQIIDITQIEHTGKVIFGTTLLLSDEDTGEKLTYQIVGEDEASIKDNRISFNSPIARALIGKMEGDIATVTTPGGNREFEVIEVRHV